MRIFALILVAALWPAGLVAAATEPLKVFYDPAMDPLIAKLWGVTQ